FFDHESATRRVALDRIDRAAALLRSARAPAAPGAGALARHLRALCWGSLGHGDDRLHCELASRVSDLPRRPHEPRLVALGRRAVLSPLAILLAGAAPVGSGPVGGPRHTGRAWRGIG